MVGKHIEIGEHAIVLDKLASDSDVHSRTHREPHIVGSQFLDKLLIVEVNSYQFDLSADNLFLLLVDLRVGEEGLVFDYFHKVSQKWLRNTAILTRRICCCNNKELVVLYKVVPLRL